MAPAKNKTVAKDKAKDSKAKDSKAKDSKSKGKSAAKTTTADDAKPQKQKPATAINVRHILCEKHSRKEEALVELRAGKKFDEVARDFSEDKARQGMSGCLRQDRADGQAAPSAGRRAGRCSPTLRPWPTASTCRPRAVLRGARSRRPRAITSSWSRGGGSKKQCINLSHAINYG